MLQTRNAKRPAQAAVRFAVDAVEEGLLDKGEALATIDAGKLDALLHPTFARDADFEVLAEGVAASPGAAKGEIVFTADDAVAAAEEGRDVILVRPVHRGRRRGRLPRRQGHPHRRGRQGQPRRARRARDGQAVRVGRGARSRSTCTAKTRQGRRTTELGEGDLIAIDGTTGVVTADDVPLEEPEVSRALRDGARAGPTSCARSACAPTPTRPRTPRKAREFGAEGIGLCRTEHMFMAADRQPKMRAMIMAESEEDRRKRARRAAAAPAGGLRGAVRGDGGPAGHDPAARPAAARVPPAAPRRSPRSVERARIEESDDLDGARAHARPRPLAAGDQPDARHARRAARRSSTRRSTRCRCARSCAPRWRVRPAAARSSRS